MEGIYEVYPDNWIDECDEGNNVSCFLIENLEKGGSLQMVRIKLAGFVVILSLVSIVLIGTSCAAPREAGVYISPTYQEASPGQVVTVEVKVEPSEYGISGGEIHLSFDPTTMRVMGYEAGDLLGATPLVGLKELNNEAGTLRYALARVGDSPIPTPPGEFMVVDFEVLDTVETGTYHLQLVKVGLANEEFEDIEELSVQNASVEFK